MLHRRMFLAAFTLCILPASLSAQTTSPQVKTILDQMNTASKTFRNARADFNCQYYVVAVHDSTDEAGPIYFLRNKGTTEMGLVQHAPNGNVAQVINYKDGLLQMFSPGENQLTLVHASANQGQVEKYLTLGFGGSGTDLAQSWNIQDLGPETVSDGANQVKTEKLDLTSKDASEKTFSHITIWVDPTRALSLRQIFYLTNHDRRTCNYSNVKLNGHLDTDTFKISKDKQTTIVNH